MADRTSAAIFGEMFNYLANGTPDAGAKRMAKKMWDMQKEYDFSPDQMACDNALVKLGLAAKSKDDEGYACMAYGPEGDREVW
jgi:hypothetical protein